MKHGQFLNGQEEGSITPCNTHTQTTEPKPSMICMVSKVCHNYSHVAIKVSTGFFATDYLHDHPHPLSSSQFAYKTLITKQWETNAHTHTQLHDINWDDTGRVHPINVMYTM